MTESRLARDDTRIWAAGVIYAVGQINFLFDGSQEPHLTGDQLAGHLGVVKTTTANARRRGPIPDLHEAA